MELPKTSVALGLAMALVYCFITLVYRLPEVLRSLFRYRIWRLRDAMFDDIMHGNLPDTELTRIFMRRIEESVVNAADLTMLRWYLRPDVPASSVRLSQRYFRRALSRLTGDEQLRFENYLRLFDGAIERHLFLGAPSGWVITGLVGAYFICWDVYRAVQYQFPDVVTEILRRIIRAIPVASRFHYSVQRILPRLSWDRLREVGRVVPRGYRVARGSRRDLMRGTLDIATFIFSRYRRGPHTLLDLQGECWMFSSPLSEIVGARSALAWSA